MPHFDSNISLGAVSIIISVIWTSLKLGGKITAGYTEIRGTLKAHSEWIKDHEECNRLQVKALNEISKDLAYLRGVSDAKAQQPKTPPLQDRY